MNFGVEVFRAWCVCRFWQGTLLIHISAPHFCQIQYSGRLIRGLPGASWADDVTVGDARLGIARSRSSWVYCIVEVFKGNLLCRLRSPLQGSEFEGHVQSLSGALIRQRLASNVFKENPFKLRFSTRF